MTRGQRRFHALIWSVLALLVLMAGIYALHAALISRNSDLAVKDSAP